MGFKLLNSILELSTVLIINFNFISEQISSELFSLQLFLQAKDFTFNISSLLN